MMNRKIALERLKMLINDEIVVATYSTASDWIEIFDRPLNFFSFGAMGLASSHGLGLALARPERKVLVLDGDGSLLMNLGTLVTISAAAPKNLIHMVWKNGSYEANGGHPVPHQQVDFAAMACAAGIASVYRANDPESFESAVRHALSVDGPAYIEVEIEQGPLGPRSYKEMYKASRRQRLHEALNA
jgi:thiamine pyrophosphate-dependent acetolactate synthase large subunit-like protein